MKKYIYTTLLAGSMLLASATAPNAHASWFDDDNPPCDTSDDSEPCGTPPSEAEELAWLMAGGDQVIANGGVIRHMNANTWSAFARDGDDVTLIVDEAHCISN